MVPSAKVENAAVCRCVCVWVGCCACVCVWVCVAGRRKTEHMALLFPAAECDAQVSWRQFKCNGASKLIFLKNNIEAGKFSQRCSNSLPGRDPQHLRLLGVLSFSPEYLLNIQTPFRGPWILHLPLPSLCLPTRYASQTNRPLTASTCAHCCGVWDGI